MRGTRKKTEYHGANQGKAFSYAKIALKRRKEPDELFVKAIHAILMKNNPVGGIYRTNSVFITGTRYEPPLPEILPYQLRAFFEELPYKIMPPIYLAAYTHAEFVKIHPFLDGNGRTSRMIMNYQLMRNGFFPISIEQEVRLSYFKHLECYALYGELEPFADMVADLEEKRLREQL